MSLAMNEAISVVVCSVATTLISEHCYVSLWKDLPSEAMQHKSVNVSRGRIVVPPLHSTYSK